MYEIVAIGKLQVKIEDLDMRDCVIYVSLEDQKMWVRPLADFTEEVTQETGEIKPRFVQVK